MAELFCEDRFGDAAVDRANCVTRWDVEDEKQMKELKRRVRYEKHDLTFDKLIELMRVTGRNFHVGTS